MSGRTSLPQPGKTNEAEARTQQPESRRYRHRLHAGEADVGFQSDGLSTRGLRRNRNDVESELVADRLELSGQSGRIRVESRARDVPKRAAQRILSLCIHG